MSGTIQGGAKASETNKSRHGFDFYARIGSVGGRATGIKGFAANHDLARIAGRKGGRKSRRVADLGYRETYNRDGEVRYQATFKSRSLGMFSTPEEAREAYLNAVNKDRFAAEAA